MSKLLREQLADVQHAIWSHWMRYMFGVCQRNEDGSMTIPADKVERWQRQMQTNYAYLTDKERESDRDQADKILAVVRPAIDSAEQHAKELAHYLDAANDRTAEAQRQRDELRAQLARRSSGA